MKRIPYLFLFIILIFKTGEIYAQSSLSQNWVRIIPQFSTSDTSVDLSEGMFVTKNIGWCRDFILDSVKSYSRIFKTTDGGYHWNLQRLVINEGNNGYFGIDSLYFWFLGAFSKIFKTTDGGITWDSSTIDSEDKLVSVNSIYFFDRSNGIAIGTSKWLTTDGGTVWTVIDLMGWFPPSDIDFSDRYHGWMTSVLNPRVWDRGSILNTKDGGYSWNYQGDTIVLIPT